jgi:hypothetical protein
MKQLSHEKRCAVIRCLVDGVSIRATTRITGVAKNSIQKLARDLGEAVLQYQDNVLQNLPCKRLEVDEIWCFRYAKDKNLPESMRGMPGVGSIWTWTAIDAESKLMVRRRLGARDAANAHALISDIKDDPLPKGGRVGTMGCHRLESIIVSASNLFWKRPMPTQEVQTADAQARISLPAAFAEAAVVVEVLSATEVRIRKVDEASEELCELPESSMTRMSDRDRDRFLALIESPPAANASLRKAMTERRQRDG